jgi:hypothetical protein
MHDQIRVQKTKIIGTDCTVFSAWAPDTDRLAAPYGAFSTFTHFDGERWGRIGTERLPAELDALPRGEDRIAAVRRFHEGRYAAAYQAIEEVFPFLRNAKARASMGEIETYEEVPA